MALRAVGSRFVTAVLKPRVPGMAAMSNQASKKDEEEVTPYVYQSPGSSLREPSLGTGHSLGNPTYEYDPKPRASLSDPQNLLFNTRQQRRQKEEDQVRAAVEAAHKAQEAKESSKTKKKTSVVEPSYVYSSPGSSLSNPSYGFSLGDPVVLTDPSPDQLRTPAVDTKPPATKADSSSKDKK